MPSAELYHPDTDEWILTASPSLPRSHHTATLLGDGTVLAVGGISTEANPLCTELYDPSTQTWSSTGPLNFARRLHATTELADGRVLVVGGSQNAGNLAEIYKPVTQAWTLTGPLNQTRAVHTATLLSDGRVLVVAGIWDPFWLDSTELFDPAAENGHWGKSFLMLVLNISDALTGRQGAGCRG